MKNCPLPGAIQECLVFRTLLNGSILGTGTKCLAHKTLEMVPSLVLNVHVTVKNDLAECIVFRSL